MQIGHADRLCKIGHARLKAGEGHAILVKIAFPEDLWTVCQVQVCLAFTLCVTGGRLI